MYSSIISPFFLQYMKKAEYVNFQCYKFQVHFSLSKWIQRTRSKSDDLYKFRNMMAFTARSYYFPPKPEAGGPSLVGCPRLLSQYTRVYPKFPDWADNEINNNNKHSLRSNTKGYGGKTH
jgi:hypothetical protein